MLHEWNFQCNVKIRHHLSKNSKKHLVVLWNWVSGHVLMNLSCTICSNNSCLQQPYFASWCCRFLLIFAWLFPTQIFLHGYDVKNTSKLQVIYFNRTLKSYRKIRTQLSLYCLDCLLPHHFHLMCDKNWEKWTTLFPLALLYVVSF